MPSPLQSVAVCEKLHDVILCDVEKEACQAFHFIVKRKERRLYHNACPQNPFLG